VDVGMASHGLGRVWDECKAFGTGYLFCKEYKGRCGDRGERWHQMKQIWRGMGREGHTIVAGGRGNESIMQTAPALGCGMVGTVSARCMRRGHEVMGGWYWRLTVAVITGFAPLSRRRSAIADCLSLIATYDGVSPCVG
jgi:hypothetical protein